MPTQICMSTRVDATGSSPEKGHHCQTDCKPRLERGVSQRAAHALDGSRAAGNTIISTDSTMDEEDLHLTATVWEHTRAAETETGVNAKGRGKEDSTNQMRHTTRNHIAMERSSTWQP